MEDYIKISTLNDFIFCPKSIYYHNLYDNFNSNLYQEKAQIDGKNAHINVDKKVYSSLKNILQGLDIYSNNLNICGKIDIFNVKTGELIERKNLIKEENGKAKIYIGYKYQLWAQMFCLEEMGYEVKKLQFYSMKNNKKFNLNKPSTEQFLKFQKLLEDYKNFNLQEKNWRQNSQKCVKCIYRELCDFYIGDIYPQLNLFDNF